MMMMMMMMIEFSNSEVGYKRRPSEIGVDARFQPMAATSQQIYMYNIMYIYINKYKYMYIYMYICIIYIYICIYNIYNIYIYICVDIPPLLDKNQCPLGKKNHLR